jgi:Skp family chaperone for outer membrane proteins
MFDIQNLAAPTNRSKKFFCDSEPTVGQRKRDAGNTRRVALNRLLHSEHKREMRDALTSGSPVDIIENEGCSVCKLSFSNCVCCDECGHYNCTCDEHASTYNCDSSSILQQVMIKPMAIFQNEREIIMSELFFEVESEAAPEMGFRNLRRNFSVLPGGRVKKIKNRRDNFYSKSEYQRPVCRINGFNQVEVREYFEDIEANKQAEKKAAAKAAQLEDKARKAAEKADRQARKYRKDHERVLAGYKHLSTQPVVSKSVHSLTGRSLPPGRVVKDSSGKLVYMVYEDSLAA